VKLLLLLEKKENGSITEMKNIKILQCGHDKSGTYLLYRILSGILRQNNLYCSFLASSGIGFIIDRLLPNHKRYPEVNEVDYIRQENGTWGFNFTSPVCRHVPMDIDMVLQYSTLCYTHEKPATTADFGDKFTHRVYILRDGRDVINSLIHFLTDEISLKLCPEYTIQDPRQLYDNLDYFKNLVRRWQEHVLSYQKYKNDFFLVTFEDLLEDREKVLAELGHYLGLSVNSVELTGSTSFAAMRKTAPQHLRKGIRGNWKSFFTDQHKELFKQVAGDCLVRLGYESSNDW
jgi:hypothetical protein